MAASSRSPAGVGSGAAREASLSFARTPSRNANYGIRRMFTVACLS